MPLSSLGKDVTFSGVKFAIKGDNPQQIIKNLSWILVRKTPLTAEDVIGKMEQMNATTMVGIGDGVTVFDWTTNTVDTPFLYCATLEKNVMFPSVDEQGSDIVLVLVSPRAHGALHLQTLSRVTRLFREQVLLNKIRSVENEDGLKVALDNTEEYRLAA